ncbi:AraC family transcriptional regulator [Facklamia sp. P9177]|uniref:AraC family transcriptional regulator n=1 Tax=Facklamia sp. P9177 TaxID=3421945 RepID=UPI003D16BEAA
MAKIEIKENKKLKLKNVIEKKLENFDLKSIEVEISKFINALEMLKAQTFGPLIVCNEGINISEDGAITANYTLYIQAHDYKQYKKQFKVLDELVVEHCLYTRFEGKPEYLQLAFNKLEIYEYEENIITRGDIYMISLEESEDHIVMDIFKPVKMI